MEIITHLNTHERYSVLDAVFRLHLQRNHSQKCRLEDALDDGRWYFLFHSLYLTNVTVTQYYIQLYIMH